LIFPQKKNRCATLRRGISLNRGQWAGEVLPPVSARMNPRWGSHSEALEFGDGFISSRRNENVFLQNDPKGGGWGQMKGGVVGEGKLFSALGTGGGLQQKETSIDGGLSQKNKTRGKQENSQKKKCAGLEGDFMFFGKNRGRGENWVDF